MTNTDKKEWSTPRLRIFARTRTEEMVLDTCKGNGQHPTSNNEFWGCMRTTSTASCAYGCNVSAAS
jgi:hypothetical protein